MAQRARIAVAVVGVISMMLIAPSLQAQHYTRTDLTQNASGVSPTATQLDPNLVNAWGLSRSSTSPWWVSDNGTGLTTLYDAAGAPQALVVTIAPPEGSSGPSAPTGTVFNFSTGFPVATGKNAVFLFVTEQGTVNGWNPTAFPTVAPVLVDRSGKAIYKGCALANTAYGPLLYATNFKTGRVDVFDGTFKRVHLGKHAFALDDDEGDDHDRGGLKYVPFNIQNVGGNLVVTFAKRAPGADDETAGPGLGRIAIFNTSGRKLGELQHGKWLNAPWGVALAPSDFGVFSHRLVIGNFGDGTIHAYNVVTRKYEGQLLGADGNPITIDGLWALNFGGGGTARSGSATELYFTAGPNVESNGLLGKLTAVASEQHGNTE